VIRGAFVLTAALLRYAFVTGPRLSSRTLVLAPSGLRLVSAACARTVDSSEVAARIALGQLGEQCVHIEIIDSRCERSTKTSESDPSVPGSGCGVFCKPIGMRDGRSESMRS